MFDDEGVLFGVAFVVVCAMHLALYALAARGNRDLLGAVVRLAPWTLLGATLILAAGFADGVRTWLWFAALVCGYVGAVLSGSTGLATAPVALRGAPRPRGHHRAAQERWLRNGIAAVPGRWNVIAQQTLMARAILRVGGEPRYGTDAWDGYPAARRRLLRAIAEAEARSSIVLSGDAHRSVVSDLKPTFSSRRAPVVATELCGPSLTSHGSAQSRTNAIARANAHILFADSTHRGYVILDLTPERCVAHVRALDDATHPDSAVSTLAEFAIDARHPGARPLT